MSYAHHGLVIVFTHTLWTLQPFLLQFAITVYFKSLMISFQLI